MDQPHPAASRRPLIRAWLLAVAALMVLTLAVGGATRLTESGLSVYRAGVQRFQMAAFETRDHLIYVISDLPQERNTELMRAMTPALSIYLSKLEG